MIRIRIGEGWVSDPEVRAGLRAEAPEPRRAAIRSIVDVLAVEVDGVDIASGRTEGPVAEGVFGLLAAIARLAAGEEHASVPFDDGAVELVLHRRGGVALLSVATLARPARLLAHEVGVDLPRLAEAARAAAVAFCSRVAEIAPDARALPELRRLLRAASTPPVVGDDDPTGSPGRQVRRTRRRPRDASCSFEIQDESGRLATGRGKGADLASLLVRGRVSLRSPTGEELLSLEGAPYLLFRDLCAASSRIAASPGSTVSFDLARPGRSSTARVTVGAGTVTVDGGLPIPCDPLAFAQAVLEGAADFCAVVRGRAPAQAGNGLLADLAGTAASTLVQVVEAREGDRTSGSRRRLRMARTVGLPPRPLAPGSLRRVSFQRIAAIEIGPPAGDGLFRSGDLVVACGRDRTVCVEGGRGSERWNAPGSRGAAAGDGLLVLVRGSWMEGRDLASGTVLWSAPAPDDCERGGRLLVPPGGPLLAVAGPLVSAFESSRGSPLWRFHSPGATRLSVLPLGSLLVVASDTGMVHALDRAGNVAWRLRGAGPLAVPVAGTVRCCHLSFLTPGGATLAFVDPATGARLHEVALDFVPSSPPVAFAGRVALAGRVAGDGIVAAIDPGGVHAWTGPSPTGGVPVLTSRAGALLAKGTDGTCAALDRDGRITWVRSCAGRPAPPGNLPVVAARGLVVVPADEVELLDAATGVPVGRLPAHAPSRLSVDDRLGAWALDAEGLLSGARVRGHLSVV